MQAGSITFWFINFGYRNKPELHTQIKAFWTINQDLKKKNLHCRFFYGVSLIHANRKYRVPVLHKLRIP